MEAKFLNLGIAEDPRSEAAKANDYKDEELISAISLNWVERPMADWKRYSMRDQDGSSSCVAQATAKAKEIKDGSEAVSAHPIYCARANFPSEGMWLQNAGEIMRKTGTTLESLDYSQGVSEQAMNRNIEVATPLREPVYITVTDPKDIDSIAMAIEKHGHCIAIFHAHISEWTKDVPEYDPTLVPNMGHGICFVDCFLFSGGKALLVDDSWGKATTIGNGGQRVVTEAFLKARFDGAMYFPKGADAERPHWKFTSPIEYGTRNSRDVQALQDILKFEGFFPASEPSSGNFLNVTAGSLKKWQLFHGLNDFQNEKNLSRIRFGWKSVGVANALYSGV